MMLESLKSLSRQYQVFASLPEMWRYRRLKHQQLGTRPVPIRVRACGDTHVLLRPGTTDPMVFWDTFFTGYHLPPIELRSDCVILDLGANAGYTAAHFAALYPNARIIAVEMDESNWQLAASNLRPYGERCSVTHAAVWPSDGNVVYGGDSEWGFAVTGDGSIPNPLPAGSKVARAVSLDTLLASNGLETIDYIKMDIEGAEVAVFDGPLAWTERVRSLRIELHPQQDARATFEHIGSILTGVGFRCEPDPLHPCGIVAIRPHR